MVRLTRLNHAHVVLNSDLIEHIDITPDTVITLTTGQILRVRESAEEVVELIVLGGTLGAVLVTNSMDVVLRAFGGLTDVFFERASGMQAAIDRIIQYATKARKHGIVSLETEAAGIADPFLRKALNLAVDGTDMQELRKMMETDIALGEQSAEAEAKVWEAAGGYAPTVGIIGAVLGLIQVMKHLED